MLRSKMHRPWQPRMDDGQIFNPFAHTTEPEAGLADHQTIDIEEAEAADADSPQHDAETTPAPEFAGRGGDRR